MCMFALSLYDCDCLSQHPEYIQLFDQNDILNTLAWQQEFCHEHLRQNLKPHLLEYEARIGHIQQDKFDTSLTESAFVSLEQLFAKSKWCRKLDTDVIMTQDMYYKSESIPDGICRTRMQYFKDQHMKVEHLWKRKLSSITIETRQAQTATTSQTKPFAIRVELSQEIPVLFDSKMTTDSPVLHQSMQYVKSEKARFKWSTVYEYESPQSGLKWHYHFNRVLEGKTKCDAEQKFRQLSRHVRYECECECVNFLTLFSHVSVKMTPIIYLFESCLVKLHDWVKVLHQKEGNHEYVMYVMDRARLYVHDVKELYNRFLRQ